MDEQVREALEKLDWQLSRIRLTCRCVNWMGGCKREVDCSLGWLRGAKETVDKLRTALDAPQPEKLGRG